MAARNYQPTLRTLLHILNRYASRYQALLEAGFTPDQAAAFATMLAAVEAMISQLGTGSGV